VLALLRRTTSLWRSPQTQAKQFACSPLAHAKKQAEQACFLCSLALLNDFRTFDWASEYKYPTVVLSQMNQLLAECKEG